MPENDTIARLRGAIVNLETTRRAVEKARAERDEAMKALLRAEAAVSESPFAGQSRRAPGRRPPLPLPPRTGGRGRLCWRLYWGPWPHSSSSMKRLCLLNGSPWQKPAALAALLVGLGITYFLAGRLRRKAIQSAQAQRF